MRLAIKVGTMDFDPYSEWLGIPPGTRPPTYYELLGLTPFESNPQRIQAAAHERYAIVHRYQSGQRQAVAVALLAEIAAAKACLCDPAAKAAYDASLQGRDTVVPGATAFDAMRRANPAPREPAPPNTAVGMAGPPRNPDSPGSTLSAVPGGMEQFSNTLAGQTWPGYPASGRPVPGLPTGQPSQPQVVPQVVQPALQASSWQVMPQAGSWVGANMPAWVVQQVGAAHGAEPGAWAADPSAAAALAGGSTLDPLAQPASPR